MRWKLLSAHLEAQAINAPLYFQNNVTSVVPLASGFKKTFSLVYLLTPLPPAHRMMSLRGYKEDIYECFVLLPGRNLPGFVAPKKHLRYVR